MSSLTAAFHTNCPARSRRKSIRHFAARPVMRTLTDGDACGRSTGRPRACEKAGSGIYGGDLERLSIRAQWEERIPRRSFAQHRKSRQNRCAVLVGLGISSSACGRRLRRRLWGSLDAIAPGGRRKLQEAEEVGPGRREHPRSFWRLEQSRLVERLRRRGSSLPSKKSRRRII